MAIKSFLDELYLKELIGKTPPDTGRVEKIIAKALTKKRLELTETATLLNTEDPELITKIFQGAKKLKEEIYGNRIVLFAPLYVGNNCQNDCTYCAFRCSNLDAQRKTLSTEELENEITTLENQGHKRLILVFGEHPQYDGDFIAHAVKTAYTTKSGQGEIRRVNINAAPMAVPEYRKLKDAGIGTFQIFQETYHEETYKQMHPSGPKANFLWRLYGLDRAQEAGLDDVGIGALFGLYDWRFEVLGLVAHTIHLEETFGVGPHTISFPRLQPAQNIVMPKNYLVNDNDFKRLVAILRLSVPYAGMILTARENPKIRQEVIELGCSQIDGGSRTEIKGYSDKLGRQQLEAKQQFALGDTRSLDEVMQELIKDGYTPSFCTACYRLGRTGEHFMELAKPGFIQNYCTPNAILTLQEYLEDYASPETKKAGEKVIQSMMEKIDNQNLKQDISNRLQKIAQGQRDLYL